MALDLLFPNFDELIRKPEDVQRLNEAILQLAVQGKLVPQDPNDEPASESEKSTEGKQKKILEHDQFEIVPTKPQSREKSVPFEVPTGWHWFRLGDIAQLINGDRGKNYPSRMDLVPEGIPFINAGHLLDGAVDFTEMNLITEERFNVLRSGKVEQDDLIYCLRGSLGKVAIVKDIPKGAIASSLVLIRLVEKAFAPYMLFVLTSPYGKALVAQYDNGSAQPNLAAASVRKYLVALPPLAEQHRIVAKVDELFAQTRALEAKLRQAQEDVVTVNRAALHRLHTAQDDDQFQASWRTIRDHFDVLYDDPRNVSELRQTILDLAVRGKLVPQDPSDELAEELLMRTNVSTVRTSGATKARQVPTVLPNIPAGWTLVSSSAVCLSINDGDHLPPPKSETGIPFLVISNIRMGKLDFRNTRFVPQEYYDTLRDERKPRQGDVLYSIVGSLGTAVLIEDDVQFCFQRHMALLRPSAAIESKYLFYLLQAPVMLQQARATATGTAQLTIPMSGLRSLVFPLPPLAEQQRIVAKVDQLMRLCDELEAGLARAETQRRNLTAAVLQTH